MAALQTIHAPELKGLYSNANRLTVPKGTVPRLCNLYLVRRGAFHTVPGSKWVSSFDGLAPHAGGQQPIIYLKWYSPSRGSSPEQYLLSIAAPSVIAHNYVLGLQLQAGPAGVALIDASVGQFLTLATQVGPVSNLSNAVQIGDYLVVALGNTVTPNIFPTVTQTTQQVGSADTIVNVNNTIAFPSQGTIQIDSELITYSSTTPTSFQGVTRGAYGSVAATHAAGALVFLASAATTAAVPVTTTLTMAMLSTDTTADVTSTAIFPPSTGQILIDSELINIDRFTTTPTSFTNLFRGANGSVPAAHLLAATVFGVFAAGNGMPLFTTVVGAISSGSASVQVSSTTGFPPTGFVYIDTECIQYAGKTVNSFTGLVRGQGGTVAAAHNNGADVYGISSEIAGTSAEKIWAPIVNNFDPTLIYGGWPGTQNSFNITSDQAAVNIGTVIFVKDGTGTAWLFRAQNSGVTGAGNNYVGPQFFPEGLIGTMASTTASSATLMLPTNTPKPYLFTASMVGQPITVYGAATSGGDLQATIVSVAGGGLSLVMSVAASTTITGPASYPIVANDVGSGADFVIGIGHFGDSIQDEDVKPIDKKAKRGEGTGTEVWLNIGQAALAPPGAAFVFQHLNYLFLWGVGDTYGPDGITGPDALWQSDFGQPMVFNAANTTFAGKGDGASAQGGAVYSLSEAGIAATPQLVLFKDAATYSFLNEFPNASLVEVSGGLGCIAPATIQFIGGYGVMRLSYAGVALFDGQLEHVTEYTDAIRGYLFGGLPDVIPVDFNFIQNCVSTQSVNPPMYIFFAPLVGNNGAVTRGFGYDFGLKQWFTMDFPFAVTSAAFFPQAVRALVAGYQSLVGGASEGTVRRLFKGDPDWDGIPIEWIVRLPDWGFSGTPTYVRRLNPLITADGGGTAAAAKLLSVFFQGIRRSSQAFGRFLNLPKSLLGSMDVGETVITGNIEIRGQGQVLIEGTDAQTSEKPTARVGL